MTSLRFSILLIFLLYRLEERAESLGAAADTAREFDAGLTRLRDALHAISDQLDDIPRDIEPADQLRKIEVCQIMTTPMSNM